MFYTVFMKPQIGEIWMHYKTKGEYEIVGLGQLQVKIEELDMKECIIYKALSDKKVWIRPGDDFTEDMGEGVRRFEKVR